MNESRGQAKPSHARRKKKHTHTHYCSFCLSFARTYRPATLIKLRQMHVWMCLLFCGSLIWFHVFIFFTFFFKWWSFGVQLRDHFIVLCSCLRFLFLGLSVRLYYFFFHFFVCMFVTFSIQCIFLSLELYFEGIFYHCYYIFNVRDAQLLFLWLRPVK